MSNPALRPEDQQRFVLRATPPLRAYLLAAIGSVVGAVLIVGWQSGWPLALGVIGIVLAALAVLLALAATVLTQRFQTTLLVARDTLTLVSGRRRTTFSWRDIAEINVVGARLVVTPIDQSKPTVAYVNPAAGGPAVVPGAGHAAGRATRRQPRLPRRLSVRRRLSGPAADGVRQRAGWAVAATEGWYAQESAMSSLALPSPDEPGLRRRGLLLAR